MTCDIMIVGEAWSRQDVEEGRPFTQASGAGQVLNSILRTVGIDRRDCYLTNVFNFQPVGNKLSSLNGPQTEAIPGYPRLANKLYVHNRYTPELERLHQEVYDQNPNVILALGATPLWALGKYMGIKKYRGTPILAHDGEHKILPTYHPSAVLRSWKLRPILIADVSKALKESTFPEVRRPQRFIHIAETIEDIETFFNKYIKDCEVLSADIETKQETITEIGFAPTEDRALVIPFYNHDKPGSYWATPELERQAWEWVRRLLAYRGLVGQNFSYDLQYLWAKMKIACPVVEDDTMLLHHAMYPEMEKSLGFLGSIYTNEPSWKFMRTDQDNFRAEG